MDNIVFIVQASSTSWAGGPDLNMNLIDGRPVVFHTVNKIFETLPQAKVALAAPEFDRGGGGLEVLRNQFEARDFDLYYGHNASPLKRMAAISAQVTGCDYFVRVLGLHLFFDLDKSLQMLSQARKERLDCMKFPDDFPVQFSADIFRAAVLPEVIRRLANHPQAEQFHVHPIHYMMHCAGLRTKYLTDLPEYDDGYLLECRKMAATAYRGPRLKVNRSKRIAAGDQLGFHYEFAAGYLKRDMRVLDIACGSGFGIRALSDRVREISGADIDPVIIKEARLLSREYPNVSYSAQDVHHTSFADQVFDAILSMETAEHVDIHSYFQEIKRILKPGGLVILSTPQNSMGRIPIHIEHDIEYSLAEIVALASGYFQVEETRGIKAGRIIIENDPLGNNTLLVLRKA